MAASYAQSIGRASLGSRGGINGGGGGGPAQSTYLPNGPCGYRDLSGGAQAPTCGCRRFWLNTSVAGREESERTTCFCGHHACFHDFVSLTLPAGTTQNLMYGSQMQSPGFNQAGYTAPTWSQLVGDTNMGAIDEPQTATHQAPVQPVQPMPVQHTAVQHRNPPQTPIQDAQRSYQATGLGIRNTAPPQSQSQSINTQLWQALNGFARGQDNGSNSGNSSKLPSTAVPSVIDEPQTSNGQADNASRHLRPMAPPLKIPSAMANEARAGDDYSATEVATPSVRGTPDFRAQGKTGIHVRTAMSPSVSEHRNSPQNAVQVATTRSNSQSHQLGRRASSVGPSLSIQEMCNTIQNFGHRIDQLESMSFAHLPSDEVLDRFDMVDGRLVDLEHWRTEQDKADENDDTDMRFESFQNRVLDLEQWRAEHDAPPSHESNSPREASGRRFLPETSSFASDGSFDSDAAAQTETIVLATLAANAETGPRLDALESRLADLEGAAMPSHIRPWQVQIVLLPFGRHLPGIWFSSTESSRQSQRRSVSRASEEWNGPLDSHFTARTSFQSNASENAAWTTASIEEWARNTQEEWLSAKACGPSGAVFQRLESRGLVRDIEITSPVARHIWSSISEALGDVLGTVVETLPSTTEKYHALEQSYIPLRKVRKSSRLRFLSPAEMLTSAIWTAEFLDSSVMMRLPDGHRRLYLTTPGAYVQPPSDKFWSWPSLRSLPMNGADGEIHAAQVVGNVIEACWSYNDRLDHRAASLHSSFAEQISLSGEDRDDQRLPRSIPITKLRRPSILRASSMPMSMSPPTTIIPLTHPISSSPLLANTTLPKRRDRETEYKADKRRRISSLSSRNSSSSAPGPLGSPELRRGGVNFTPRWSREPLSPYTRAASSDPARNSSPAEAEDHSILLGRRSVGAFSAGSREGLGDHRGESGNSWGRGRGASGTPFAYATPHSGVLEDEVGPGDTEVEDDDDDDDEGSEASWPGWEDGMEV